MKTSMSHSAHQPPLDPLCVTHRPLRILTRSLTYTSSSHTSSANDSGVKKGRAALCPQPHAIRIGTSDKVGTPKIVRPEQVAHPAAPHDSRVGTLCAGSGRPWPTNSSSKAAHRGGRQRCSPPSTRHHPHHPPTSPRHPAPTVHDHKEDSDAMGETCAPHIPRPIARSSSNSAYACPTPPGSIAHHPAHRPRPHPILPTPRTGMLGARTVHPQIFNPLHLTPCT